MNISERLNAIEARLRALEGNPDPDPVYPVKVPHKLPKYIVRDDDARLTLQSDGLYTWDEDGSAAPGQNMRQGKDADSAYRYSYTRLMKTGAFRHAP